MYSPELIQAVAQRLVETYNPYQLYLFGSYAWGTPSEESDLDFMVVLDTAGPIPHSEFVKGHLALIDFDCSKDILISPRETFEQRSTMPATLQAEIAQRGKLLYATHYQVQQLVLSKIGGPGR